jgi:hypothetical protein
VSLVSVIAATSRELCSFSLDRRVGEFQLLAFQSALRLSHCQGLRRRVQDLDCSAKSFVHTYLQEANQELLVYHNILVLIVNLSLDTLQVVDLLLHGSISLRADVVQHSDELSESCFVRCCVSLNERFVDCSGVGEVVHRVLVSLCTVASVVT